MKHVPQDIRKLETRKKIVDAAILLFSTKGYYKTNSKEIAKEAGVSIGSFYSYFTDKKVLLIDILNTYMQEIMPQVKQENDVVYTCTADRKIMLKNLVERCFHKHTFSIGFYQQVTLLSSVDEEIGLIFEQFKSAIMIRIKEVLVNANPSLLIERQKAACIIIYSSIEGAIHTSQFNQNDVNADILVEELVDFLDLYVSHLCSGF